MADTASDVLVDTLYAWGVCLATPGPGGMQLLNGLYDARLDLDRLYEDVRFTTPA